MPATRARTRAPAAPRSGRFPPNSRWSTPSAGGMVPVTGTPFETVTGADGAGCRSWPRPTTAPASSSSRAPGRLCAVHRTAGPGLLPSACRNFPRVALRDPPRDVRHAVALLPDRRPASAAGPGPGDRRRPAVAHARRRGRRPRRDRRAAAAAAPGHAHESRRATTAWEREAVATLNDRRLPPPRPSRRSRRRRRRPATGGRERRRCPRAIEDAFADARDGAPSAAGRVSRAGTCRQGFLAAHAFASWAAYQHGGLGAAAAAVQTALRAVRAGARRGSARRRTPTLTTRSSPRSGSGLSPEARTHTMSVLDRFLRYVAIDTRSERGVDELPEHARAAGADADPRRRAAVASAWTTCRSTRTAT